MYVDYICDKAHRLIKNSQTRDPFTIAEDSGIMLIFDSNLDKMKGMYTVIKRNRIIIINNNMSENMQRIVCAHELGHDALHREWAKQGVLKEFMLYDMRTRPEYEANAFAAEILIDDTEVEELISYGYDMQQIAMELNTDINLVGIKLSNMNWKGADYKVPIAPQGDFLKD